MIYKIEFSGMVAKQFRKQDNVIAAHIKAKIDELTINPNEMTGAKAFKGKYKYFLHHPYSGNRRF